MTVVEDIPRRARHFRERFGMTQSDAAEHGGLRAAIWADIESGDRTPTLGDVLGMSWALGVPFSTMLGFSAVRDQMQVSIHPGQRSGADEDAVALENVKDELAFFMEIAEELRASGHLERLPAPRRV